MTEHQFVGIGFGPIQGGLFAKEAFQSGNFVRIVVAEVDAELVDAVSANNGSYYVNVAKAEEGAPAEAEEEAPLEEEESSESEEAEEEKTEE